MRRNPDSGFTLVEMMVSLALSGLVLAGAFSLFASQRPIYQRQMEVQSNQQDLWLALEILERDARKAGFGFGSCSKVVGAATYRGEVDVYPAGAAGVRTLHAVEVNDGGAAGTDALVLSWSQSPGGGGASGFLEQDQTVLWHNANAATVDAANDFTVPGRAQVTSGFETPKSCLCGGAPGCNFPWAGTAALPYPFLMFQAPQTTLGAVCSLVQLQGVTCSTGVLSLAGRPTVPWQTSTALAPHDFYQAHAGVYSLGSIIQAVYSIDNTDPTNPTLIRTLSDGSPPQIVAYGIEDLQVVPTCDVNNDGIINAEGADDTAKLTDEWLGNVDGEVALGTPCTTFPQLRVTLVSRAKLAESTIQGGRPAVENHDAGDVDHIRRRMLGAVISIPNLTL